MAQHQPSSPTWHNRSQMQAIMDGFPVPCALNDEQMNITFLNKAFIETVGYTTDDIAHLDDWWPLAYPDEKYRQYVITEWQARLDQAKQNNVPFSPMELRIHCKDGSSRLFMGYTTELNEQYKGEHLVTLHDITDTIRHEQEMKFHSQILQNLHEGIHLVRDDDGVIVYANQIIEQMFGYAPGELINQHVSILNSDTSKDPEQTAQEIMSELREKGYWQGEVLNQKRNGEAFWRLANITRFEHQDYGLVWVSIHQDITEKKQIEHRVWHQANYDSLTQLPNRNLLTERLDQEIKLSLRNKQSFALLFLDLDHFKNFNDTLGHSVGDQILLQTAQRIQQCIRESDTAARLGGDEFIILLPQIENPVFIEHICQKLLDSISHPMIVNGEKIFITASIGVSLFPTDSKSAEELFQFSDQAMYQAKMSGRNSCKFFTQQMQAKAEWHRQLSNDMREAIIRKEFELFYQPIVNLSDLSIHKAEALIRWHHPRLGMVSPDQFIPLAEENGLISDIGEWVFQQATQRLIQWRKQQPDFQISINKSPVQFSAESVSPVKWVNQLTEMNLPGEALCIEITEGVLLSQSAVVTERLHQYLEHNIHLSIDDFGTGYSSLTYLKKFSINFIKIDKSFVHDIEEDGTSLVLCEAIIAMAHQLGLKVVAEGIEIEAQRQILTHAGCDYGQGYLFARPAPAEQLTALLKN